MNSLVSTYSFLTTEPGPLKLYKVLLLPHHDFELIHKICSNSTMTGPSIIYKSPLLDKICASSYSFEILPFMGHKAFQCFFRSVPLKSHQKIEILGAIPITIRRQNVKNNINLIDSFIENADKDTCFRVVIKAIQILREIINEGKLAHEYNKAGKCYKNEFSYNSSVLMVFCKKCNQYMCLVCGSSHTDPDHSLSYVRSNKPCKKSSENLELVKDLFEIKEICMSFFDSLGNSNEESTFSSDKSSEEVSITTLEEINPIYDDSRHSTLLYYELEIIDAGFSENISIGIDGVGVRYSGNTGIITDSIESFKQQAPRYGTGDVVGIGLTSSHFLYFTFNGYNLHIYIKCNDVKNLRPLIKFKGKGIVVRVITNEFYFLLSTFYCSISLHDPFIKSTIAKWINKLEIGEEDCRAINNSIKDIFDEDVAKPFDKKVSKKIKACDPCRIF